MIQQHALHKLNAARSMLSPRHCQLHLVTETRAHQQLAGVMVYEQTMHDLTWQLARAAVKRSHFTSKVTRTDAVGGCLGLEARGFLQWPAT